MPQAPSVRAAGAPPRAVPRRPVQGDAARRPALVPAPRPPRGIKRPLGAAQGELLATAVGTPTGLLPTANLGPFSAAAATLGGPRPSAPPNPNPVPVAQPPPVLATPSLNPPTNLPAPFKAPTTE